MTYRVRNIGIAVALALVAALLTSFYVTNYKRHVQSGEERVRVLVAGRDIPAGTPGSLVVDRHMLAPKDVSRKSVVPGAISSPDQIARDVATQPVYAGEQVTTRRFGPLSQRGIHGQLKGNLRALQVAGDQNQLLAGTVRTGDHVDVVGNWVVPEQNGRHIDRVVLRDLLVLRAAVAQGDTAKLGPSGGGSNVILALTDSQAQKFFFVMQNGDWSLQLRPSVNAADSPDTFEDSSSVARAGLNSSSRNQILHPQGAK